MTYGDELVHIPRGAVRAKRYISPLATVRWRRVCLDEAQQVESTATMAAKMALELDSRYRWCVTGTPLQSGLNDIYGLMLFLGASPWGIKPWWDRAVHRPWEAGRPDARRLVSKLAGRCNELSCDARTHSRKHRLA